MHIRHPVAYAVVGSVVFDCSLDSGGSVFDPCFVMQYLVYFIVLQSS